MQGQRYFVAVAARDAIDAAVTGGYVEINHGRAAPLARMRDGDALVWYAPRVCERGEAVQAFCALAFVNGDTAGSGDENAPAICRRAARYVAAQPAPIRPLIDVLDFIRDKRHWGIALRYGFVQISAQDFVRIAHSMGCDSTVLAGARPAPALHDGASAAA